MQHEGVHSHRGAGRQRCRRSGRKSQLFGIAHEWRNPRDHSRASANHLRWRHQRIGQLDGAEENQQCHPQQNGTGTRLACRTFVSIQTKMDDTNSFLFVFFRIFRIRMRCGAVLARRHCAKSLRTRIAWLTVACHRMQSKFVNWRRTLQRRRTLCAICVKKVKVKRHKQINWRAKFARNWAIWSKRFSKQSSASKKVDNNKPRIR